MQNCSFTQQHSLTHTRILDGEGLETFSAHYYKHQKDLTYFYQEKRELHICILVNVSSFLFVGGNANCNTFFAFYKLKKTTNIKSILATGCFEV